MNPLLLSAFQPFALLVSLLMKTSALLALLEPSSLRASQLLLSASFALSDRFLRMVRSIVSLAQLSQQLMAVDLLSAFQSLLALLVSLVNVME